ncbi:Tim17/Tim22/Tim23/Pmp24 family-domain-containing protein [Umbelopsis sp. PMI_123]|nr:Tim17/Tim22/Tim23/Pmp24 family-domain-containing protein [Umbelopsis sp. PMI_123]
MSWFGGSSSNSNTSENLDDAYSSGGAIDSGISSYESLDNSYEKVPDFMTQATFNTSRLQPMAAQGGVDFLQLEESTGGGVSSGGAALTPSRGWTDDLCYGTGTTYLAGLTLGGAVGLAEGVRKGTGSPNMKIRLNTTLNSITRRGPGLGNSVGVIAMLYNGTNAMIGAVRGEHDAINSVAAGAISGAIFKSTAGVRPMGLAAGACAALAGVWSLGKEYILA